MTKAQIIARRIAEFNVIVDGLSEKIHKIGNASWDPITETDETKAVRAFLTQKDAGIDYLNKKMARSLKMDGRVVKFAGLLSEPKPLPHEYHPVAKAAGALNGASVSPRTGHEQSPTTCTEPHK